MTNVVETNNFNTQITQELFDSLNQEVREELLEIISSIDFIRKITSPNIKRAIDLPKDKDGRIIIDVTEPHILEDMDYFRPSALHFIKTGRYTDYKPSKVPNSPFRKWISEERRRCYEGYVRESDGEWITGDYYFFLNYCPMMSQARDENAGISVMKMGFPLVMDGQYYFSHYIWQARLNNNNAVCLASRGRGKSAFAGSMLAKRAELGETSEARKFCSSMVIASATKFLDGAETIIGRFTKYLDHVAKNTKWPRRRIRNTTNKLRWEIGYMNNDGTKGGVQNTVIGVTIGDDPGKIRGSRASLFIIEEFGSFGKLKELYENLMPSVKNGNDAYGQIVCCGTSGDKDSDFEGAKELFYNPIGHDIQPLKNVWDKPASGRNTIAFFYPAYLNTKGFYDKNGNSDVLGALIFYLKERYKRKYNSDDPMTLIKYCAENPITPEESMMKTARNFFPTAELNERIKQLENDENAFDEVEVGELFFRSDGTVDFKHTNELPIRYFPHTDNKIRGAVEIFQRPVKDEESGIPKAGRYIASCIPEGEKILTNNGIKNIENVLPNDKLYSINGDLVEIKNKFKRYVENEKLINIQLFDIIDEYKLTWNHPIYCSIQKKHYHQSKYAQKNNLPYVYRTYDFNFLRAEDVKEGMFVKVPNIYKGEGTIPYYLWNDNDVRVDRKIDNPLNKKDFWWLIGLIIGDGWASSNGYGINCCFNSNEKEYIDKYKKIVSNIFNRNIICNKKEELNKKCVEYSFSNKQFNKFFKANFGTGAENKNLPEWVKFLPDDLKIELLMGYLASDGYVSKNGIEYVSVSKKLLKDFQDILFSIGIISSLTKLRNVKTHTFNYKNKIYTSNTKETYHLRINGKYAYKFLNKSYLDYKLKNLEIKELENHEIIRVFFEDDSERFIYFKVKKVDSSSYTGDVYNFHCKTSTYMYGYLPTHNCDPIDKDKAETMSLSSTFVFDLYTDTIVAEYTGRRDLAIENYEITRMLCHFYNAQCYFENNLLGFKGYMQTKGDLIKYVAQTPNNLKTQGIAPKETISAGNYGIRTTTPVIDQMNFLIRDWLTTEVPAEDADGNEIMVKNLYLVKNIALLKELVAYNDKGNFDRVRSFGCLMIGRDERISVSGGNIKPTEVKENYKDDNFISQCLNGGNKRRSYYKNTAVRYSREEVNRILNIDSKLKLYHF